MDTRRLQLAPVRTATLSRGQLSPLTRRFAARFNPATIASLPPRDASSSSPRIWSRDLLDRLQVPLTRYRE